MAEWDDDNFEPRDVNVTGGSLSNKWEGEDEEDEVKRLKREAYEKRVKEVEEEISSEEQLRRQKESDLTMALETTFSSDKLGDGTPGSKEEFQELSDNLTKNIQQFSKNEEYPVFAENLIRGICATLSVYDLKKIKTTIDNMVLEKQKLEKGDKPKKSKGKGKAKLKIEGDNPYNQYSAFVDDFDDFGEYI
ncbi:hypothetical protein ILUMI_10039 [Ignelater luminosus]|uniref:Eukaryotic translation initiation factor 3 30 kDa subunit n=1 Tax=Ignelater luminosus TaxID=2038154 RepID=A0A8K0D2S4_IGNLU|nr:hypothetical protein ILUMI_10039 [Ignelater luminosus]